MNITCQRTLFEVLYGFVVCSGSFNCEAVHVFFENNIDWQNLSQMPYFMSVAWGF